MNTSKILYQILGGLLVFTIVMGAAGIGVSREEFKPKHPYLSFLKGIKFFNSREYSTQMSKDRARDVMLLREKTADNRRAIEDKASDQRLTVAMNQQRQAESMRSVSAAQRLHNVRHDLEDLRLRNKDTLDRYRQMVEAQRFR